MHQFFNPIFNPFWSHFGCPNASQNHQISQTKSIQTRIWQKKRDFSKNSTPFEREAHFGGSRALKTIPKSTKNVPETDKKFNQKFDPFFNRFFNDFNSIWAPSGAHLGHENRLKRGRGERGGSSFATTARRTRPGVPPEAQNGRPRPPQDPKMDLQGCPKTLKMIPKVAQGHPRAPK